MWCTGGDAPISELVDFIFAAQIAESQRHDNTHHGNEETIEVFDDCFIVIFS